MLKGGAIAAEVALLQAPSGCQHKIIACQHLKQS